MARRRHQPGCPCCSCILYYQEFDGATWETAYTAVGDWAISSGTLVTDDETASLISDAGKTGAAWIFELASVPGTEDNTIDLIVKYADADNYLFLRFKYFTQGGYGQWSQQLFSRIAGTDTALSDEVIPNEQTSAFDASWSPLDGRVTICVQEQDDGYGTELQVTSSWNSYSDTTDDTTTVGRAMLYGTVGDYGSLGTRHGVILTGNTDEDQLAIESIKLIQHTDGCVRCQCWVCENGTMPETLWITTNDVENGPGLTNCKTSYNGRKTEFKRTLDVDKLLDPIGGPYSCVYYGPNFAGVVGTAFTLRLNATTIKYWHLFYGSTYYAAGTQTLTAIPIDCETTLDQLVLLLSPLSIPSDPMATYCRFGSESANYILTTDLGANSITIYEPWTYLSAGKPIRIAKTGQPDEWYTLASAPTNDGSVTTLIFNETLPASRVGWYASWHATATISLT